MSECVDSNTDVHARRLNKYLEKSAELMKSYTFKVILERDKWPDEPDKTGVWRAYIPALPVAHAWGDTQREALDNLRNAVDLIVEDLQGRGEPIPTEPASQIQTSDEPLLTVTL